MVKTLSLSLSLPLISAEISEIEMPVARPEASDARVIAHVDMDCFYVQGPSLSNPNCIQPLDALVRESKAF